MFITTLITRPRRARRRWTRRLTRPLARLVLLGAAGLLVAAPPALATGPVTFLDVAAGDQAGISYRRVPSATQAIFDEIQTHPFYTFADLPFTPLESRGMPGIAILDHDRDGDLDLYVTNGPGANNSLYSNQLRETGRVTFVDVAVAAGVGAAAQDSSGVCAGDLDNDGYADLYVLGADEPNKLFKNLGNGAFADITVASGTGAGSRSHSSCAMGDVNGDGQLDIVVANTYDNHAHQLPYYGQPFEHNDHNQLFLNAGNDVFVDASAASGLQDLAGLPPELRGAAGISWAAAMVDFDLDGDTDIVIAQDQSAPLARDGGIDHGYIRLFRNDGTGRFSDATFAARMNRVGQWMTLAFGDVNCDGRLDIFGGAVGDYGYTVLYPVFQYQLGQYQARWFLGQADGTFSDPGVGGLVATPIGWGSSMVDYDNDGATDIVYYGGSVGAAIFIESSNPGAILHNESCSASFTYDAAALAGSTNHTRRTVLSLATGDLDDNGFADIVSASSLDKPAPIPLLPFPVAYGSPFDAGARYVPISYPTETLGVFRWSGDVYPDGTLAVELNSGDNGNGWVRITALGTAGLTTGGRVNRDGIGAMVWLTPLGGRTAMLPVLGGGGRGAQSGLTVGFGLGAAPTGDVEILWPGGARNRLYAVRASEQILFPEIPCSYAGAWGSLSEYHGCVSGALGELVRAGRIDEGSAGRFLASALRAFADYHYQP
jgi:hypothetical protein